MTTEQDHWLDVAVDCHQCTPDVAAKAVVEIGKRDAAIAELVEALDAVKNRWNMKHHLDSPTMQIIDRIIAKHKAGK